MSSNVIELNGKRYDAVTGTFVGQGSAHPNVTNKAARARSAQHGAVIDGFMPLSAPHAHPALAHAQKPAHHAAPHSTPQKSHAAHKPKPLAPHRPEHSKTLMRHAVKPPTIAVKKPIKPQVPTDIVRVAHKPGVLTVMPKLSSEQVDPSRAGRALAVPHSTMIQHFTAPPRQTAAAHARTNRPPARTHIDIAQHTPVMQHAAAATKTDIFEHALAHASSHEQPAPKESHATKAKRGVRKHSRGFRISAALLAAVLLGGFIAYQNKADLQLQLASAKAGFQATMPGYKPPGYAVKGLTYSPGTVSIGFLDAGKSFSVVQKASNWDSQTLLQNYVATSGQSYNAYQAAGRTVYVYGNGNATWVNGGIWYQVNDNANLSKDQIINLVTSM